MNSVEFYMAKSGDYHTECGKYRICNEGSRNWVLYFNGDAIGWSNVLWRLKVQASKHQKRLINKSG